MPASTLRVYALKWENDTNYFYVGSTTQKLVNRKINHLAMAADGSKRELYEYIRSNNDLPYNERKELEIYLLQEYNVKALREQGLKPYDIEAEWAIQLEQNGHRLLNHPRSFITKRNELQQTTDDLYAILSILKEAVAARDVFNKAHSDNEVFTNRIKNFMLTNDEHEIYDGETGILAKLTTRLITSYRIEEMPDELILELKRLGLLKISGSIPPTIQDELERFKTLDLGFILKYIKDPN